MNSRGKKARVEWAFFINPKTEKIQYNAVCLSCAEDCKQSYKTKIENCSTYKKKHEQLGGQINDRSKKN